MQVHTNRCLQNNELHTYMGSAHVTDLFPLLLSALLSLLWLSLKVDAIALMRNKGDAAQPFWR